MSARDSFQNQFHSSGVAASDGSLGGESDAQIKFGLSKSIGVFISYQNQSKFIDNSSLSEDI